jgi:DMSO/TMAO reductase YedYZ heme-binding membrane subunit
MSLAPLPSTDSLRRRLQSLWGLLVRYAVVAYVVSLAGALLGVPVVLVAEYNLELVEALRYTLALGGVGYAALMVALFSDGLGE